MWIRPMSADTTLVGQGRGGRSAEWSARRRETHSQTTDDPEHVSDA
jgi:hypothetical protein